MNIAILSTSPRQNSNTFRFSSYLQNQFLNKGHIAKVIDFHNYDLPNFSRGGVYMDNLTLFQEDLLYTWQNAQLVIIATPEYNWSINGDLLNMLHQLGSEKFSFLFNGKIFAFAGVSTGRGGKIPCIELTTIVNKIISFTNQYAIVSPKIYESHETAINIDENGQSLGNPIYEKTVNDFVDYTLKIAELWNNKAL